MKKNLFIYKENNTDDRDCVNYITSEPMDFSCGHYFSRVNLVGACFSKGFNLEEIDFDNITTILSKEEFETIKDIDNKVNEIGYGIEVDSEKYNQAMELKKGLEPIWEKLKSNENEELFERVVAEEIEFLEYEYNLDLEEIENIFDNYNQDYRDRAIVGMVYSNFEELGEECMASMGSLEGLSEFVKGFFDYEGFGEALAEDESYLVLEDERIVYYMY